MSNGPIEYLGEGRDQRMPPSEYGGNAGLVQPDPHEPTASERNAAIMRAALTTSGIDPVTGLDADALAAG